MHFRTFQLQLSLIRFFEGGEDQGRNGRIDIELVLIFRKVQILHW